VKVIVGVITFRRPAGLATLLEALRAQAAPVVVVDNDPAGSARAVSEGVQYMHEPRRGLSFARNRAIAAALEQDADYLAFIDDDEVPTPGWLDELVRVAREHAADVVAGPVVRRFTREAPQWVLQGRFFEDPHLPTGTPVRIAATSNVLIARRVLAQLQFDPRFGLTGGEDTHYFLRATASGYRIVWAQDAVVEERVPAERARLRWILRRAYRVANTWSLCERELSPNPRVLGTRVVKAIARLGLGGALVAAGLVGGRHIAARGLWHLAFGAGNLTGLAGVRFAEYHSPREKSASRS
jgi:GT2 family glycosyltransferase